MSATTLLTQVLTMRRIAKALAVSVPLFLAFACSDECAGPDDCEPGELCIRPAAANGERGAAQCVPGVNQGLTCSQTSDCGSPRFECVAQRCVLIPTTVSSTSADSGVVDAADASAVDTGVRDAGMGNPDAAPGADAAPADSGVVMPTPCERYCADALSNCTGLNQIYTSSTTCMLACAEFASVGTATTSGNSRECRANYAATASVTPGASCAAASIAGGGVCGTYCDVYCDFLDSNCTGANAQYASRAACDTACMGLTVTTSVAPEGGDSVQCRSYHASFPAQADPALHCSHAGQSGGGVCD